MYAPTIKHVLDKFSWKTKYRKIYVYYKDKNKNIKKFIRFGVK
jgi:hypothetical protein